MLLAETYATAAEALEVTPAPDPRVGLPTATVVVLAVAEGADREWLAQDEIRKSERATRSHDAFVHGSTAQQGPGRSGQRPPLTMAKPPRMPSV